MAKKKPAPPAPTPFEFRTEACPKMRRRWRRDTVPELLAWLMMIRNRLARALAAEDVRRKAYPQMDVTGVMSALQHRLRLVQELTSIAFDQWSEHDWASAVENAVTAIHEAQAAGIRDRTIDVLFPAPKSAPPKVTIEETEEWPST